MRSPVVIGATGGSGTRGLRAVLAACGAHMGVNINDAGDAADFFPFYDQHINPTLQSSRRLDYALQELPELVRDSALQELQSCLAAYLARFDPAAGPWGIKGPRSMYMLPYLCEALPGMTFLHLIRDGRDMALSTNQWQVKRHYAALFGEPPGEDMPVAAVRLWSKANREAAAWCAKHLTGRYLTVRYEDLCRAPAETIAAVLDFLRWPCPANPAGQLATAIRASPGIDRWRNLPAAQRAALTSIADETLRHFGYRP